MKKLVLALSLFLAASAQQRAPRVVTITAKKFEFTPNVVTLAKGEPVTLRVTSLDRAHGLLINALHVDLDIDGGDTSEVTITPMEKGTFPAICDHYCGAGHGNMKMTFIVE